MKTHDVIIVGGGPAGASCAWRLIQHGLDCLVLDRCDFPRLKLCAGWITPAVLRDLQIKPGEYPHGLLTFRSFSIHIGGRLWRLPTKQHSIRRYQFDEWLLRRSRAPVEQHEVRQIVRTKTEFILDDRFACRYLVGAGGTHCPVARTFFSETNPRGRPALVVTQEAEFEHELLNDRCHLWFLEDGLPGYSWFVPKGGGYVNIGVGGMVERLENQKDKIRRHWDQLMEKLMREAFIRTVPEPKGHSYYLREPGRRMELDRVYIIGDAAGLATVDMGEGIHPAIHSGLQVAEAIFRQSHMGKLRSRSYSFVPGFLLNIAVKLAGGTTG